MSSRQDTSSSEGVGTRLAAADVVELLRTRYDITVADVEELGGEVDQNLRILTDDGDRYLLKASVGDVDGDMRWQETVLSRLGENQSELPVPALVEALDGQRFLRHSARGEEFVVRLMSWLPGRMLAEIPEQPESLLVELGAVAARITQSLSGMDSSNSRSHAWDLRNADGAVRAALPYVHDRADLAVVERIMNWFESVKPLLETLPAGVVHQDLNDFNVLVDASREGHLSISGVIDVADALFTARVTEVAIAAAYAMLRKEDPLWAACAVVKGFHSVEPLTDEELRVVFPLAAARLCVNGTVWLQRTARDQGSYGKSRMRDTWPAIRRVAQVPPTLAELALRSACGLDSAPVIDGSELRNALSGQPRRFPVDAEDVVPVDLSPASDLFDDIDWRDASSVSASIRRVLGGRDAKAGVVGHLTPSLLHSDQRAPLPKEPASLQLGTAILTRAGANVYLPLAGRIVQSSVGGPVVIEHASDADESHRFWTCWRGVQLATQHDAPLPAGELLGQVSGADENAGLGAVVHVQVVGAEDVARMHPPIRIRPSDRQFWELVTADLVDVLADRSGVVYESTGYTRDDVVALRDLRLARSQRAYYRRPPNLVRGRGVWLYDENGFAYLDAINNVTHVGHANPRVTAAATAQLKKLNTNSRFIYEGIATYAERLVSTLPAPLEVVFLVCTGSEANDLALRMARQVTGRTDVMVIDGAYHGNTAAVMGISPNRYKGPGGMGAPPTTHEVVRPDVYRGPYGREDADAGLKYASDVASIAQRLVAEGRPPAAFIAESLMGTAGNIVFPDGYLEAAFDAVRATGGLCISDEVQVGVGRLGSHFWGFQAQGVVPDIVTMGKPLGNGHPIAAVVTTREIADAFDDGVKYFNTFGGNPVSCAVGTTVLDIVQGEGLQARALQVGKYFLDSLTELQQRHELIGDVRGHGLYLGIELVRHRETKEPASQEALLLSERMKDAGVIVYPTGAYDNVLKLKPPMVFGREHVDNFVTVLDRILGDDPRMNRRLPSPRI